MTLADAVLLEEALRHGGLLSPEQANESRREGPQMIVATVPSGLLSALRELAELALTPVSESALRRQVMEFEIENAGLKAQVAKLTGAVNWVLEKAKAG